MVISDKPLLFAEKVGLKLPNGYVDAKALGLVNLTPWHFLSDEEFDYLFSGLGTRYPHHKAIPYARRSDNDDVACFVRAESSGTLCEVVIIHDFASLGYEVVVNFDTFWEWFQHAVAEMVQWHEAS